MLAFGVALMASGISASTVGTHAGQVVMAGFTRWHVPLVARRALTAIPALVILALPVAAGQVLMLIYSQVALSFGIPFALVPLLLVTRDHAVMGDMVNRRVTSAAMLAVTILITALNVILLAQLAA
ncbi:MAG: manganese transport protein MntH [Actinomycetia bacterium]|nr:manganese transport protein MntH [Actinomycetes bacterium]